MHPNPPKEFRVFNRVRCLIFILLYVEIFLLAIWAFSSTHSLLAIGVTLLTLPAIAFLPTVFCSLEQQIFDRIRLQDHGIEYLSGIFGEQWDRPYNEFRVDCQTRRILFLRFYNVRLKHRVLANLLLGSSGSQQVAQQKINELVENTRLRFTKN